MRADLLRLDMRMGRGWHAVVAVCSMGEACRTEGAEVGEGYRQGKRSWMANMHMQACTSAKSHQPQEGQPGLSRLIASCALSVALCSLLVQAVMGAASSVMYAILAALISDAEAGSHSNGSAEAVVWRWHTGGNSRQCRKASEQ